MWTRRELFVVFAAASLIAAGGAAVLLANSGTASGLLPFRSYSELSDFLTGARSAMQYERGTAAFAGAPATPIAGPATGSPSAPSAPGYSGTNVQVAGVDELDMVKTDGTYLYIASQGEVDILLAYPADSMHVVSRIALGNLTSQVLGYNASASAIGLFLDGGRLVVVGTAYGIIDCWNCTVPVADARTLGSTTQVMPSLYAYTPRTLAFLFDVSDSANPALLRTVSVTGYPSTGRMVDGIVYLVATQWIEQVNGTYVLPQVCVDSACRELSLAQIYHDPQSADSWDYTNLLALDLASKASSVMSIVTGGYSMLYMSPASMYLAFFKWSSMAMGIATPMFAPRAGDSWTTIYKLRADGLEIEAVASADIPGSLLSQYAMDEWQGYLRVAATVRTFTDTSSTVSNSVYVFNGDMKLVGSVVGLAPGETIFAVRFVGDRAYVVTFRKIDPLFVIDLSFPAAPAVSGFLEMPGFSDYLYPLDAGHLVGVGKSAIPAGDGNWSWYQGLKLALYDVTDPTAPSETSNVSIGDRGSDSEVLTDPHAFLYIPDRQLLVLPVDLAVIDPTRYPYGVPEWAWGTVVWQGVFVYRVNETTGFQEIGRISHDNGTVNATCGWYGAPNEIRRSLFIGDTLYTVSGTEVKANSLTDLSEISSVVYASAPGLGYGCPVSVPMPIA